MRAAFFSFAPFALVFIALIFPVSGAMVQVGLALAVFIAGEWARRITTRSRVAAALLSGQLEFEAYYREHQPRPFLYYVLYPVLFPYWLSVAEARREFLLYKGYTLFSFGLLLVSLVAQYLRSFPPELTLRDFVPLAAGTLLAEAVVVLMFLMPIVTTVVHFQRTRAPRRLAVLLLAGLTSMGFATARVERRRDPIVSYATRTRVRLRSAASPAAAQTAQVKALHAAWKALPGQQDDVDSDGKVEGAPLSSARDALVGFYKNDEAHAFDLWYTKRSRHGILVLYFEARRGNQPIWLAMSERGHVTQDVAKLPQGAFLAMRHAAR
ncbi:MAG: hypothetical protein ACHQ53_01580 [Polyangiales bacterium]